VNNHYDVVIVGGGAAGVGAARRLAQTRLTTLLLEASSRLGGRAWTEEIAGYPLDLGCGWFHSAERNAWVRIARAAGLKIDQTHAAWGNQFRDLGFTAAEQAAARKAMQQWMQRLSQSPPANDCAADALAPGEEWNAYLRAIAGFISGATLERLSAADYVAYDDTSTDANWRTQRGFGALVARSFPPGVALRLATPVESMTLRGEGVTLTTHTGEVHARAAILTMSTEVLAGDSIKLPRDLDPWRETARQLPLGHNEKLFLGIVGDAPFEDETQVIGNPRDARTGAYYIRPFGWPVIECFVGGEGCQVIEEGGPAAGFAFCLEQLSGLFGADIRRALRPLAASNWSRMIRIGGAYSYALPGHRQARAALARPFDKRVFFAGEATSAEDFSTTHGAHDSGVRAAIQVIEALR
jgi:monoamine oxidase